MSWEQELFTLLDDLEQQAAAVFEAEREVELRDRARSEYAGVTLSARLLASAGSAVRLRVRGVGWVEGELDRAGPDWCLVRAPGTDWVLPLAAVLSVRGASARAVPDVARTAVQRLGLASALRRLSDAGEPVVVRLVDGTSLEVELVRIGADFAEARTPAGEVVLLAHAGIGAVQSR